jgi:hypothetical protein
MPKVRTGAAEKFVRNAAAAAPAYTQGVQSPRTPWAAATLAGAANQAAGVQAAITAKRFEKGVQKAGDAKYLRGAIEKGASRFTQGVQTAQGDYATGVAPYTQVIESTQLPPRYAKGDPRNIERVRVMSLALRAKKLQL